MLTDPNVLHLPIMAKVCLSLFDPLFSKSEIGAMLLWLPRFRFRLFRFPIQFNSLLQYSTIPKQINFPTLFRQSSPYKQRTSRTTSSPTSASSPPMRAGSAPWNGRARMTSAISLRKSSFPLFIFHLHIRLASFFG